MIQSVQTSDRVQCQPPKDSFKGMPCSKKKNMSMVSRLQAAELKYGLACLWAASAELENARLRHELASSAAQANYCRACL